jgi:hypothetical protein
MLSPSAGVSYWGTALDPMILGPEVLHIGQARSANPMLYLKKRIDAH